MSLENQNANIGHNQPNYSLSLEHTDRLNEIKSAASEWLTDVQEIEDQETCDAATALKKQASALAKDIDDFRVSLRKPLNKELKEIQAAFVPTIDLLKDIKDKLGKLETGYLIKVQRRIEEEQRLKAQEAEEKRRLAEEAKRQSEQLMDQAAAGDLSGSGTNVFKAAEEADALESLAKAAEEDLDEAMSARAKSGSQFRSDGIRRSTTLRKFKKLNIVNPKEAFDFLINHDAEGNIINGLLAAAKGYSMKVKKETGKTPDQIPGVSVKVEERAV